MKKIIPLLMVLIIFSISIVPQKADAIGVVGSSAVKNAVINSLESVGVKFTSKDAKEKAFQAWNMKAYEKWKADEAAGRNADLWAHFESVQSQIASAPIEPIPDKPNFGKMLLDATWFGMAISIGAEIGFAIEDAQAQNRAMKNLVSSYEGLNGDYSLNPTFGFTNKIYKVEPGWSGGYQMYNEFYSPKGSNLGNASSMLEEVLPAYVYAVQPFSNYGTPSYMFYYRYYQRPPHTGKITEYKGTTAIAVKDVSVATVDGGFPVEWYPKPEHVPSIQPNPYVEPLITPNPDIGAVPSIIPQVEPVPVVVPLNDPYEDNPYVIPFEPAIPPIEVPENPENPENPTNPDNPVEPVRPPYQKPEAPPVEKPEYPGETTATDTPGLFSKLWEWLKSLLDVLFKILNAIIMLPFTLLEMLWDFLIDLVQALFVPDDGYWDKNMDKLKKLLWADEIEDLQGDFEGLGGGSGGSFKDVIVNIMGVQNVTVIDADSINSILNTIHKWVRGVIYPLILLFNINMLYKLIRGTSLVEVTRSMRYKSGGD